jgi:hypothetical protein
MISLTFQPLYLRDKGLETKSGVLIQTAAGHLEALSFYRVQLQKVHVMCKTVGNI